MDGLRGLLDEVQSACGARLREIAAEERQKAAILKNEARARFEAAGQALARRRGQQLREAVERRMRRASDTERSRLWAAERACFDALMAAVSAALAAQPPSQPWFDAHLAQARKRLGAKGSLQITLNVAWQAGIRIPSGIKVHTAPLIGGFRLADSASGVEVDASWDRRLDELRDRLWQRWHERIHHQD